MDNPFKPPTRDQEAPKTQTRKPPFRPTQHEDGEAERPRNKGKGKGKQQQARMDDVEHTTASILASHAKAILRLDLDRRQRNKDTTFIVGFNKKNHGLLIREIIPFQDTWRMQKPEQGPHPQGSLAYAQWSLLMLFLQEEYRQYKESNGEISAHDHKALQGFFSETPSYKSYEDTFDAINPIKTFRPLFTRRQPPEEEEGWWLWTLQCQLTIQQGRRLHESLLEHRELLKILFHMDFRKDRADADGLTNAIQQLESLQI